MRLLFETTDEDHGRHEVGRMLSPLLSTPRRCLVRKLLSIGLTTLLTMSVLICLFLAAAADGVGPGG